MKEPVYGISFRLIQILLWIIFFLAWAVYTNNKWTDSTYGIGSTVISIVFYILAVYANSLWLMPRYFRKGSVWKYLLFSVLFLAVVIIIRAWLEKLILMPLHKKFYDLGTAHFSLVFLTTLIAFLFGSLLFVARNYIGLLKTQEKMKSQQLISELDLLKQQVQPHFLFNTLNNIYSLAHSNSENTKVAIAKLADIMRYFMEDAPRERTALQKEIEFIRNYISLEQLRMLHPVQFTIELSRDNVLIPPMLLMPFVENLFKHGVDKTRADNEAGILLEINDSKLRYTVTNKMPADISKTNGFGLSNLRKRLELLYGNNYILQISEQSKTFKAFMEIPL